MKADTSKKVVVTSGGFDPVHIGHVRMFREAKALGDHLIVLLNNDHWLKSKKGYVFMPEEERKEIIECFSFVDEVIITKHEPNCTDMSVCNDLKVIKPTIFCNGGDRKEGNIPEYDLCDELGIKMKFNVGAGGKIQSSSWLVNKLPPRT